MVFPSLSEFSTVYCDPHKGFGIVNKAERDVFLELSCFFHDPADVGNLISGSSSLIAQLIKNPPAMQQTLVRFLGWEDPMEKG